MSSEPDRDTPASSRHVRREHRRVNWKSVLRWSPVAILLALAVVLGRMATPEEPVDAEGQFSGEVPIPADERLTSVEFDLDAGESRMVALDMEAILDASTGDRRGAYTSFGIACGPVDGGASSQASTGTQNLRYQDGATLRAQFVYAAEDSGAHRCNANFRVPNWDPDFGDAAVDIEATLSAAASPETLLEEAAPTSTEPIVPDAGETATVIDETVPIDDDLSWLEASATAHMTTCSIEEGSRDGTDENLCTPEIIDRQGSSVRVVSAVELVDDGEVCDSFILQDEEIHISHHVHHFVSSTEPERFDLDAPQCGDELRLVQRVENEGPAGLVAHRGSSTIIVQAE